MGDLSTGEKTNLFPFFIFLGYIWTLKLSTEISDLLLTAAFSDLEFGRINCKVDCLSISFSKALESYRRTDFERIDL